MSRVDKQRECPPPPPPANLPAGIRTVLLHRSQGQKIGLELSPSSWRVVSSESCCAGKIFAGDSILTVDGVPYAPGAGQLSNAGLGIHLQVVFGEISMAAICAAALNVGGIVQEILLSRASAQERWGVALAADGVTINSTSNIAASSGLSSGQRILGVNDQPCTSVSTFLNSPGGTVKLHVWSPGSSGQMVLQSLATAATPPIIAPIAAVQAADVGAAGIPVAFAAPVAPMKLGVAQSAQVTV